MAETLSRGDARLTYAQSSLGHAGELGVLRLRGDALALGAARGQLHGEALAANTSALIPSMTDATPRGGIVARLLRGPRTSWRYRKLDDGIPGHQLVEIYGAMLGAAASPGDPPTYKDLVRIHASPDIGVPAGTTDATFRWVARSLSFATTLGGASGERLIIGRNFELPGAADGGAAAIRHRTVAFVHPDGAIPYASVEWPGWIGVVSGMNAEGIAVMVHPAQTGDVDPTGGGQPVALLARDILEHARSLEDAIGVLREAEPIGAAAFLLAHGHERDWLVVELSPDGVAVRRAPDQPAVTGLLEASAFSDDPENDRARRTWPALQRAARVAELLADATLETPADAAAVLRDRRGEHGARLPPGHRGAIDDPASAHTAIFDVTGMVLYVAEGAGASGRFHAFDLRHELRGEGTRPAPPAPIEPVLAADSGDAHAVLAARLSLREARSAAAEGRGQDAWGHLQRALARVPELPEALVLAGDYAIARGDSTDADALYRRYLEAGADAPGTRETVRARLEER